MDPAAARDDYAATFASIVAETYFAANIFDRGFQRVVVRAARLLFHWRPLWPAISSIVLPLAADRSSSFGINGSIGSPPFNKNHGSPLPSMLRPLTRIHSPSSFLP